MNVEIHAGFLTIDQRSIWLKKTMVALDVLKAD